MDTQLRLALAASLSLAPLIPLSVRLAQLQVMQHRVLESRASGEFNRSTQEITPRADIVDRDGKILAHSVSTWSCFVERSMVRDARALSQRLAKLLSMPEDEVLRKLKARGRFASVKTDLDFDQYTAVSRARLEGVGLAVSQQRFYPNEDLARGVLGLVGSDSKGLSGVELAFESKLTGGSRRLEYIRDGSGRTIYKGAGQRAEALEPLRLTIDRNIQYYAEEALKEASEKFQIKGGLIAVQDPQTGEILAMAASPANALKNPIIQDTYEPGSTFKVIAAAAALEDGLLKEDETVFCENGLYEVSPGVFIHDHEPAGALTLQGILERSSNIGIAKVVERVGPNRFYRMSRAFGFSNKSGLALPGETSGDLKPLSDLTRVTLAASSYGYGVGVSALQVLNAYSAIANGGTLYEPVIIKDGRKPVKVRRVASARTVESLGRMLENIVERGTGATAQIPGYRLAGKTGTARKLDRATMKYSQSQYVASFAGYLPAGAPRWTVLVVIDEPKGQYYGGQVAAPIFAKLGLRLLTLKGVPPEAPPAAGPMPTPGLWKLPALAPGRKR